MVRTNSAALAVVASEAIAVAFAVILFVFAAILLVRTNSAALAVVASEVKAVFNVVRSVVFALRLMRFDKLEVSIVTPPPPVEKL